MSNSILGNVKLAEMAMKQPEKGGITESTPNGAPAHAGVACGGGWLGVGTNKNDLEPVGAAQFAVSGYTISRREDLIVSATLARIHIHIIFSTEECQRLIPNLPA